MERKEWTRISVLLDKLSILNDQIDFENIKERDLDFQLLKNYVAKLNDLILISEPAKAVSQANVVSDHNMITETKSTEDDSIDFTKLPSSGIKTSGIRIEDSPHVEMSEAETHIKEASKSTEPIAEHLVQEEITQEVNDFENNVSNAVDSTIDEEQQESADLSNASTIENQVNQISEDDSASVQEDILSTINRLKNKNQQERFGFDFSKEVNENEKFTEAPADKVVTNSIESREISRPEKEDLPIADQIKETVLEHISPENELIEELAESKTVAEEAIIEESKAVSEELDASGITFDFNKKSNVSIESETLNEDVEDEPASLNDRFKAQQNSTLADKIKVGGKKDLKELIDINDRFMFIQQLFGGSYLGFEEAMNEINRKSNLADAKQYIDKSIKSVYKWDDYSQEAQRFMTVLEEKFN